MNKFLLPLLFLVSIAACDCDLPAPPAGPPAPGPTESPKPTPIPSPPVPPPPSPPSPSPNPKDMKDLFIASDSTHEKVDKYVAQFIVDGTIQGIDVIQLFEEKPKLRIQIGSLDNLGAYVIGLCETGGNERVLTLDPDFFNSNQDDIQNQLLVSHELGHCILYRPHRADVNLIPDGQKHEHEMSIMNPIVIGTEQYKQHKPYYDRELFTEMSISTEIQTYVCPDLSDIEGD